MRLPVRCDPVFYFTVHVYAFLVFVCLHITQAHTSPHFITMETMLSLRYRLRRQYVYVRARVCVCVAHTRRAQDCLASQKLTLWRLTLEHKLRHVTWMKKGGVMCERTAYF